MCVLHDDGFWMVFAASLNLMICTATICNSLGDVLGGDPMGFPSFWTNPGSCAEAAQEPNSFGRLPPSETKPESVVIRRSSWGKGHLTSLSTGASEALGMLMYVHVVEQSQEFSPPKKMVKPKMPFWSHLGMVYSWVYHGVPHQLLRFRRILSRSPVPMGRDLESHGSCMELHGDAEAAEGCDVLFRCLVGTY